MNYYVANNAKGNAGSDELFDRRYSLADNVFFRSLEALQQTHHLGDISASFNIAPLLYLITYTLDAVKTIKDTYYISICGRASATLSFKLVSHIPCGTCENTAAKMANQIRSHIFALGITK